MRALFALPLLALLPLASAAVRGGKVCQVADSAVPTPGLADLVMGARPGSAPSPTRLTEAQITILADLDTKLRRSLQVIESRAARLPAGARGAEAAKAELALLPLPDLVTRLVADATRDQALVLDCETAPEFGHADAAAPDAGQRGDETRSCPPCRAVRRGVEAGFAWKAGEHGRLSPAEQVEAAELAAARDEARRTWKSALVAELGPEQLAWLRKEQMRWLESTMRGAVADGLRALGTQERAACATTVEGECALCSIVLDAIDDAKAKAKG